MLAVIKKGFRCLRENGVRYTLGRLRHKWEKRQLNKNLQQVWILPDTVRETQESTRFEREIKVSILTPLYNTPIEFLTQTIQSVQNQTYANWELCLCDGSDSDHSEVGEYCLSAADKDSRVKYEKLTENAGISENTNACIRLSSGDYLALLDHDDILHPSALFEVVSAICEKQADFIYTDEAKFATDVTRPFDPNFKPDYAKDELRAHNYICHLTVYSRALFEKVGYYNSEYDGSQDHDMVLRMTEKARSIVHIPKILYFWRVHKGSVSSGVEVKSYAIDAAHKAVSAQLERCGETGSVDSIPPYQSLYKVDYDIADERMVSVILYGITAAEDLTRCVKAMEDMTSYYPMELLIVEGSIGKDAFKETLRSLPTVKPVHVLTAEEQESEDDGLNLAVRKCSGDYVVFLHAATVMEERDWVREMLMFAQRTDVGAVGTKLYDGNHAIFSTGLVLDSDDPALVHPLYRGEKWGSHGYEAGLLHVRNVTAVDGQCLMAAKAKLLEVGGLRKELGAYQFIDLCLRLRRAGFLNVCTPFAAAVYWGEAFHGTNGKEAFFRLWKDTPGQDPYYNPNVKKYKIY